MLSDEFVRAIREKGKSGVDANVRHLGLEVGTTRSGQSIPSETSIPNTDLAAFPPLKLETRGTSAPNVQGLLWSKLADFRKSVAAKLREHGEATLADELDDCHSYFTVAQCTNCRRTQSFPNRCDRFYCPECQPRLGRQRRESVEWWTKLIPQPKHVVLTVRNTPDLTRGHVRQLKSWFANLRRRKFARAWQGGFYSIEVTNEGNGWHLHIHALVNARWIDGGTLATEWCKATNGAGHIVKVKDCRSKDYIAEITKYAVKGTELAKWTGAQIATFIHALKGAKCFGVFGELHGKRTEWREWIAGQKEKGQTCECGCQEFRYFTEEEWAAEQIRLDIAEQSRPPPKLPGSQHSLAL